MPYAYSHIKLFDFSKGVWDVIMPIQELDLILSLQNWIDMIMDWSRYSMLSLSGSSAESLIANTEQWRITPRSAVSSLLHSTHILVQIYEKKIFILKLAILKDILEPFSTLEPPFFVCLNPNWTDFFTGKLLNYCGMEFAFCWNVR